MPSNATEHLSQITQAIDATYATGTGPTENQLRVQNWLSSTASTLPDTAIQTVVYDLNGGTTGLTGFVRSGLLYPTANDATLRTGSIAIGAGAGQATITSISVGGGITQNQTQTAVQGAIDGSTDINTLLTQLGTAADTNANSSVRGDLIRVLQLNTQIRDRNRQPTPIIYQVGAGPETEGFLDWSSGAPVIVDTSGAVATGAAFVRFTGGSSGGAIEVLGRLNGSPTVETLLYVRDNVYYSTFEDSESRTNAIAIGVGAAEIIAGSIIIKPDGWQGETVSLIGSIPVAHAGISALGADFTQDLSGGTSSIDLGVILSSVSRAQVRAGAYLYLRDSVAGFEGYYLIDSVPTPGDGTTATVASVARVDVTDALTATNIAADASVFAAATTSASLRAQLPAAPSGARSVYVWPVISDAAITAVANDSAGNTNAIVQAYLGAVTWALGPVDFSGVNQPIQRVSSGQTLQLSAREATTFSAQAFGDDSFSVALGYQWVTEPVKVAQ